MPITPVYQWRTAVIAATYILSGKQVPKEWVLPAPVITNENLSQWVTTGMPPQFYESSQPVQHPLEQKFNATAWDILCAIERGFRVEQPNLGLQLGSMTWVAIWRTKLRSCW